MSDSLGPHDCSSTPGFPVHHQLPELAQTHVHQISDAIQPPHPLLSPSPPAFNLSQHQGLFQGSILRIGQSIEISASESVLPTNIQDCILYSVQFSSVAQSCQTLCDYMNRRCQTSLSFTISQNLLKLMSVESVMPSNHLILCHFLLHLLSIFPSIRIFSSELDLCIRWPKYWSFSFSTSPSNEYSGVISFRIDWFDLAVQGTLKSLHQHHKVSQLVSVQG